MGYEALALFAFALITLVVSFVVILLVLRMRKDVQRVQQGLVNLAGVNARTNMYAQSAIAQSMQPASTRPAND